jgi:hypothetical protein
MAAESPGVRVPARLRRLTLSVTALLTVGGCAWAQPPPQLGKAGARATLDFRVGAMWPGQRAVFAPVTKDRDTGAKEEDNVEH